MTLFPGPRLAADALSALNNRTSRFGLVLTPAQAAALQRREQDALSQTRRVCFGGSIVPRLAQTFADSPFIQPCDWVQTLGELTRLFYELKDATHDRIGDEELLARMAGALNGRAQGDLTAMTDAFFLEEHDEEADAFCEEEDHAY